MVLAQNDHEARARRPLDAILNACGVGAPVLFTLVVAVAGALHPGYSHVADPISVLAARGSPYRDLMTYGGMIPTGLLTMLFSVAVIRRGVGSPAAVLSGVLIALLGAGRFLAGVFPCDPGCAAVESVSARLHVVAATLGLLGGSLSPLTMAFALRTGRSRGMFVASLGLGLGALAAWLAMGVAVRAPALTPYFGLFQRLMVGLNFAWMIVLAVSRGNGSARAPTPPRSRAS